MYHSDRLSGIREFVCIYRICSLTTSILIGIFICHKNEHNNFSHRRRIPLPHHVQFKKTLLVNEKLQIRNRAAKSRLNTFIKKVHAAKSKEDGELALKDAVSLIDSTAHKGIIKKETAARKKSRLFKFVAGLK